MLFGSGSGALFGYPLIAPMHHEDFMMVMIGSMGLAILLAAYLSAIPATLTEMFPDQVRVSALSVGFNISLAIFEGTTSLVAPRLLQCSHDDLPIARHLIFVPLFRSYLPPGCQKQCINLWHSKACRHAFRFSRGLCLYDRSDRRPCFTPQD